MLSPDCKIISYEEIPGKYGYFDCQVEKEGKTWRATIYPAQFRLRMFVQDSLDKTLTVEMAKELEKLISDYSAEQERWSNYGG